jgi:hypothetical protein
MVIQPFALEALAVWLRTEGAASVLEHRLGECVLVGHIPEPLDGDRWTFKTQQHVMARSEAVQGVTLMMTMLCWSMTFRQATTTVTTGLRLGRAPGNNIVMEHSDISKLHARLMAKPGGVAIADAGSSNGTFINGVKLVPDTLWMLRDRDLVPIGPGHLQFLWAETLLRVMAGD